MKLYKGRENLKEFKPHRKVMEDDQERENKEEKGRKKNKNHSFPFILKVMMKI